MKWLYLTSAILFELLGTTSMKLSEGLTKTKFIGIILISYLLSLSMLSIALKEFQLGIAYATWSGLGIVLVTIVGVVIFKEPIDTTKIIFTLLIITGVVGLNLTNNHQ